MEKVVIRKDPLNKCIEDISFLYLNNGNERYKNIDKLISKYGYKYLLKKLFNEDIECDSLSESALYKLYSEILQKEKDKCYKENDKFIELYKIDEDFALQIDFNIHLYHLVPKKEFYTQIVPWYYTDSKKYLGDTWGEQDEEVIESIQNLSMINFLKRYKGY